MTHADNLCLGMAAVYSFFGVTLAVAPKLCWGPESPLSYWTEMDESGIWFGRCVGICKLFGVPPSLSRLATIF